MAVSAAELRRLDTETFGQQVRRCRDLSRVDLREAAEWVSRWVLTSYKSLSRLERLGELPTDLHRRAVAYLTILAYGFDPEQFGLTDNDLPRSVDAEEVRAEAVVRMEGSTCLRRFGTSEHHEGRGALLGV